MEQVLLSTQEQGVLASDEIDVWQQELKVADAKERFTFAGMMFAVEGRK